jgi:adenosylhomocysteine nucleosidase
MYFRRAHQPLRRLRSAPCYVALAMRTREPFLLLETGVGRRAIETAFDWLLAAVPRPRLLVYAGFAGALDPTLRIGDVLCVNEVVDTAGRSWHSELPADRWAGTQSGRLFTADQLVATPDEKQRLAAVHGARIVDMESAHVAARCIRAGIPFLCVRAVSDAADRPLSPSLVRLLSGGRVSGLRVAMTLCRAPSMVPALYRLAFDTRIAARQLAHALDTPLTVAIMEALEARQTASSGGARSEASTAHPAKTEAHGRAGWPLWEK